MRVVASPKAAPRVAVSTAPPESSSRLSIQQLGPECIPLLQYWLSNEPRYLPPIVTNLARKLGFSLAPEYDLRELACFAALEIPESSSPLTPQLLALCTNASFRNKSLALRTLKTIHLKPPHDRPWVITALLRMKAETVQRSGLSTRQVREIEECMYSWDPLQPLTENSEYGQMSFLASLSESQKYPHRVLPILFKSFTSTNPAVLENRAQALGNYGALAADALPQLSNLMNHPKSYVRRAASNAIQTITLALPHGSN